MHPFSEFVNPYLGRRIKQLDMDKRFVRGEGCYLFDHEGQRYLDFIASYGALPFGFNPACIWDAVMDIRDNMEPSFVQPSNLEAAGELARRLVEVSPQGLDYVTFTNSGAEAVEAAIKMARSASGRPGILTTHNSFHGKTLGALSATGKPDYQTVFGVPTSSFDHIPFDDIPALRDALETRPDYYAAFMVEPIQGEGGIIIPSPGYLTQAKEICTDAGVLFVLDEIQTGLGRTGRLFACQDEDVQPDILILAKALSGGLVPLGAVLGADHTYCENFGLKHSSTFGGNTLACRVGLASLDYLMRDEQWLVRESARKGSYLLNRLEQISDRYPDIIKVRGRGLMIGLDFVITREMFPGTLLGVMAEQELLTPVLSSYLLNTDRLRVAPTLNGKSTIRIEPPLVVTDEQCDYALDCLERTVEAVSTGNTALILRHLTGASPKRFSNARPVEHKPFATPSNDPDEGRFAFLVHPIDISNYAEFDRSLEVFTHQELEDLASRWNDMVEPFVVSSTNIISPTGARAYGEFVGIPRTADEMLAMPRQEALDEVASAIELARGRGARIVGLGAYTAVTTYGGLRAQNLGVPVTTGNSYTVVSAADAINYALDRLGSDPAQATVAVVGASGAIGRGTTILLAGDVGKLLLIGNPAHPGRSLARLRSVAEDLCWHVLDQSTEGREFADSTVGQLIVDALPSLPHSGYRDDTISVAVQRFLKESGVIVMGTEIGDMVPEADVVMTATSNVTEIVSPQMIKHGAVICDISRPPNVSREVRRLRKDVLVIDGGVIALPGRPSLGWDFGFDEGLAYACMAETMMLALEHQYEHASIGSNLTLEFILHTRHLAEKHGFSIAELRSFDRPLGAREWEQILRARSLV